MFLRLQSRLYYTNPFQNKCKHLLSCYRNKSTEVLENREVVFKITENPFKITHSVLKDSIYYQESILPQIKTNVIPTNESIDNLYRTDWLHESTENVFKAIKLLTYYCLSSTHVEDVLYDNILNACNKKLPNFSDQQIKTLLQHLVAINDATMKVNDHSVLLKSLNKECLKRFFPKDLNTLLMICDAFYQLQDKSSDYMWRAIRKISSKTPQLYGKQIVQLLLYTTMCSLPKSVNMFEIEERLEECISEIIGNEIGIITNGFCLKNKAIRNTKLVAGIIKQTNKSIKTMDSFFLNIVMLSIRSGECRSCTNCISLFQDLLKSLHTELPRLSLTTVTQIAETSARLCVYDATITHLIIERLQNELNSAKLSDIKKVIFSICTLTPLLYTDVCHTLLDNVLSTYKTTRLFDINRCPILLVHILASLTIKKIYVPELIEFVFNPAFVQKTYKNNLKLLSRDYLSLHGSIKAELPDYEGRLLNNRLYNHLIKNSTPDPEMHHFNNIAAITTEIVSICKDKLRIGVHVDYVLPHHATKDIIFAMDKYDNFIESEKIETIFSLMPTDSIRYVNTNELEEMKWKIIILLPVTVKVLGLDDYIGPMHRKLRQIRAAGYTPIPIYESTWNSYSEDVAKKDYLKQLVYQATDNELRN